MTVPAVSVVMAIREVTPFLTRAISSVLWQSMPDFEFLIVTNGAADAVKSIVRHITIDDPRVRCIDTPLPGLAHALNIGIAEARSEFVARMDADDVSLPNRLERQLAVAQRKPELSVIGCRAQLIDAEGAVCGQFPFFDTNAAIRQVLPYRNPLLHPALLMRRGALLEMGGYRYGHMSEDHELFIRMAREPLRQFENVDEVLFQYRRHPSQITSLRNARRNYAEISGFLTTEFLLTKNPKYLLGCAVVHPLARRIRQSVRTFLKSEGRPRLS